MTRVIFRPNSVGFADAGFAGRASGPLLLRKIHPVRTISDSIFIYSFFLIFYRLLFKKSNTKTAWFFFKKEANGGASPHWLRLPSATFLEIRTSLHSSGLFSVSRARGTSSPRCTSRYWWLCSIIIAPHSVGPSVLPHSSRLWCGVRCSYKLSLRSQTPLCSLFSSFASLIRRIAHIRTFSSEARAAVSLFGLAGGQAEKRNC